MDNFRGVFLVLFIFLKRGFADTSDNSIDYTSPQIYVFWPNATIPFYINPDHYDHEQSLAIMSTLALFAFKTCLKFEPALTVPSDGTHVMVFENPRGIRKCVVDTEGHPRDEPRRLVLGYDCLRSPQIDMIIMKALGFPFEHNRNNRDSHIEVLMENIEPSAMELFTRDSKMPAALQALPYDINSVMHFGERDYSKNGHRTIMLKDSPQSHLVQNRVTLTSLDLRKIEIVYGPECRTRDRQEKLELCQNYPGVARRKREINIAGDVNLRVNRDITPPPDDATVGLKGSLNDLGIANEVQEVVDQVYKVSAKALTNARAKYCNVTKTDLRNSDVKEPGNDSKPDLVGIIESITDYAQKMVDNAVANLTLFCQSTENIETYEMQRSRCAYFNGRPCPETYRSTKSGAVKHSTQHRPVYYASTKNVGGSYRNKPFVVDFRSSNKTDGNDTSTETTTEAYNRRKRSVSHENTTVEMDVIGTDTTPTDTTPANARKKNDDNGFYNNRNDRDYINERKSAIKRRADATDSDTTTTTLANVIKIDVNNDKIIDDLNNTIQNDTNKVVELKNSDDLDREVKVLEMSRSQNLPVTDAERVTNMPKKLAIWARKRFDAARSSEEHDWEESFVSEERPTTKKRKIRHRPRLVSKEQKTTDRSGEKQRSKKHKKRRPLRQKPTVSDVEEAEEQKSSSPLELKISTQNKDFYQERKWPNGVVKYIIKDIPHYDIADMRSRLEEVNAILKKQTCVKLREITEEDAASATDYLVIDNSADYVTGRVGGRQSFGALELFRGGQHRQHAAMMVMAMLGFYFEIARHDRDKYIRVHLRHVRPDKLHHFEKIRADATLPLPYDYESATHPAWQFWRKIGKKGISTVATYKTLDPDGSIMKSLGQNQKLFSDMDIVKINTIYGTRCFRSARSRQIKKKRFNRNRDRGF